MAMMMGDTPCGIAVTSSRRTVMLGCDAIASVTASLNASRPTASAAPAGTAVRSAQAMISEPSRRSSFFSSPSARSGRLEPRLFEHTSSAIRSVSWAGVMRPGRISYSVTCAPRCAACHAASLPASPAPMTTTAADELLDSD